jgi:hypothetical protein
LEIGILCGFEAAAQITHALFRVHRMRGCGARRRWEALTTYGTLKR